VYALPQFGLLPDLPYNTLNPQIPTIMPPAEKRKKIAASDRSGVRRPSTAQSTQHIPLEQRRAEGGMKSVGFESNEHNRIAAKTINNCSVESLRILEVNQ